MAADWNSMMAALNGDLFVPNDIGEADVGDPMNHVTLYTNAFHLGGGNVNGPITVADQLRHIAVEVGVQSLLANPVWTDRQKNVVLAGRAAAYKLGLLRPDDLPNTHNCSYNECIRVVDAPANAGTPGWINFAFQGEIAKQATNVVCHMAYIFRWRGHHYKDEYMDVIAQKWGKNLNARHDLLLREDWEFLFTRGMHAIFPDVLDAFWVDAVNNGRCCNPLAIRVHVPCAGTAPFFAMMAGIKEANLVFPTAIARCQNEVNELTALCTDLHNNRWKGGVNRVFYGGAINPVSEGRFTALAAIIFGMNTPEDNKTDLGKSQSLTRVAKNAPLSTLVVRSTTSGILKMCLNGDTQSDLGNNALKRIVFADEKKEA